MDDKLVILTLSEFRHIIEIATDSKKSDSERKNEIMDVFKNRIHGESN